LAEATKQSYNVPFYWLTKKMGPDKVVEAAKAAGVKLMWSTDPDKRDGYDLTKKTGRQLAPEIFNTQVGYGQYPITVLDHANGLATLAARGMYRPAHFVVEVKKKDPKTGQWKTINGEQVKPVRAFEQSQVDDIVSVLADYPGKTLSGRASARKTGTWELNSKSDENGDAWMVGFNAQGSTQLATAVWVGDKGARTALRYKAPGQSSPTTKVQGSNLPAQVWKRYMDEALKGVKATDFPPAAGTGNDDHEWATGVKPTQDPGNCFLIFVCTQPPGGGGPGGGGGGGHNGPAVVPTTPPAVSPTSPTSPTRRQ
jgi:membrane peptidoglycan carboxypeptidase